MLCTPALPSAYQLPASEISAWLWGCYWHLTFIPLPAHLSNDSHLTVAFGFTVRAIAQKKVKHGRYIHLSHHDMVISIVACLAMGYPLFRVPAELRPATPAGVHLIRPAAGGVYLAAAFAGDGTSVLYCLGGQGADHRSCIPSHGSFCHGFSVQALAQWGRLAQRRQHHTLCGG